MANNESSRGPFALGPSDLIALVVVAIGIICTTILLVWILF